MAEIFFENAFNISDPLYEESALRGVPDWRKRHIMKYKNPIDRKMSLGAWRLMENVLQKKGFSPDNVTLGASGKLLCYGAHFNLSHSGGMIVCAFGGAPVGCDIEKAESAPFEIMERVFLQSERDYIDGACNGEDKIRRFFKIWTMKESYIKMTGEGLSISPIRVEIDPKKFMVKRDFVTVDCELFNASYGEYEVSTCEAR